MYFGAKVTVERRKSSTSFYRRSDFDSLLLRIILSMQNFGHESIAHYYGDMVRALFFLTVVLSFIAIPFWGHLLPFGNAFEIAGGIIFIALAGLTSPHAKFVMVVNAIASGVGAFLFEYAAVTFRAVDSTQLLLAREMGALALLGALYFSIKTLRAISQGTVGEMPWASEFDAKSDNNGM